MSVLSCDRLGCENIMCDKYSPLHGYICNECFEELCRTCEDVGEFMERLKEYDGYVKVDQREYYESVFEERE